MRLKSSVVGAAMLLALAPTFAADQNPLVMQKMDLMPLAFTQNNGQWADSVLYRAGANGATMWFTDGGVYYQFTRRIPKPDETSVGAGGRTPVFDDRFDRGQDSLETMMIKASFVGANPNPRVAGQAIMEYKCNYFLGNDPAKWRTDVPNYQAILLEGVYPGIDLKYYGDGRRMEYDFVVSPGTDPSQICVKYDGAKSLRVDKAGGLVVETKWGKVSELAPMAYQMENGERRLLEGSYLVESDDMFSFRLSDDYNPELAVIIDPVLTYSTYLGGLERDCALDVAADDSGYAYVTGLTNSSNFPILNPYQSSDSGGTDVFVSKLSKEGSSLVYSTYIGGNGHENAHGIAVDDSGCSFITGYTSSTNFPTVNPFQTDKGGWDTFVAKLSNTGNELVYSTYLGGGYSDFGRDIDIDSVGCAYVTGETFSSDFPAVNPIYSYKGQWDIFITKVEKAGNALVYSTCLGGTGLDEAGGISVDNIGCVYITGFTQSTDFPCVNAYQSSYQGGVYDAIVAKISDAGSNLVFATYLGGDSADVAWDIKVDRTGYAYVTGETKSTNFPVFNSYQIAIGGWDAFVTKFSSTGSTPIYSTYLGGSANDYGYGIDVDGIGRACVIGYTASSDFPTVMPYQIFQGDTDVFVTKLSQGGDSLIYSTYLGGAGNDFSYGGIFADSSGSVYVAGETNSEIFPTVTPYQMHQGGYDAFVAKLCADSDGDGIADVSDNCTTVYNPNQADADADGVGNACDNCPTVFNPDQADSNNNGTGDACLTCCDLPGDANNDGSVNVGDAVYIINYVFKSGPVPPCKCEGDANGDNAINVGDAVYLINYVFKSGPAPICNLTNQICRP